MDIEGSLHQLLSQFPVEREVEAAAFGELLRSAERRRGGGVTVVTEIEAAAIFLLEQRLCDLERQCKEQEAELVYCRAKIQRRNLTIQYIQETLQLEIATLQEELLSLIGVSRDEQLKRRDVGLYSLLDFLQVVESESGAVTDMKPGPCRIVTHSATSMATLERFFLGRAASSVDRSRRKATR